jgi:hypothetical protein
MGTNPCPPNSFYWEYAATKQWAKDGTRLTKPIGAALTQSQKGVGINPRLLGSLNQKRV